MTRKQATRHLSVISELRTAAERAEVSQVVLHRVIGIEYITLTKYLSRERTIVDDTIARRMVVTTKILNELVTKGDLPLPPEINLRYRREVTLQLIDDYITKKEG